MQMKPTNVEQCMSRSSVNWLIAEGLADLVAFGRPYIANPDLVERLAPGAPLAEIDWKTVYASGPGGYYDYPARKRISRQVETNTR
jgi:N-ethylmaleimide reductase